MPVIITDKDPKHIMTPKEAMSVWSHIDIDLKIQPQIKKQKVIGTTHKRPASVATINQINITEMI